MPFRCSRNGWMWPGPALCLVGVQPTHGDQAEPEVADFGQQPMQRGLVSDQAAEDRLLALGADVEAVEPSGPPGRPGHPPRGSHTGQARRRRSLHLQPAPGRSGEAFYARCCGLRPRQRPAASLPFTGGPEGSHSCPFMTAGSLRRGWSARMSLASRSGYSLVVRWPPGRSWRRTSAGSRRGQGPFGSRVRGRLRPELAQDVGHVRFDRAVRHDQVVGDALI